MSGGLTTSRIPETLPNFTDPPPTQVELCNLAARWGIQLELARRLVATAQALPFGIQIISGSRSRRQQELLEAEGRPAAPWRLTTHADEFENGCPRQATGADIWPLVAPVRAVQAQFGAQAVLQGLRWGGGSPVDPETGIPSDWNHVDLGPRSVVR